jgi:hypothetical protein
MNEHNEHNEHNEPKKNIKYIGEYKVIEYDKSSIYIIENILV